MSLSFVTKAIQTTAADGTFEEQAVEDDDDQKRGSTRDGSGIGLFDQLRQNKDEDEASRLEFQRSIMRGTLALDEDDAAHLQQLQHQKAAETVAQERYLETQLASFRAAQAERFEDIATIVERKEFSILDSSIEMSKPEEVFKSSFAPTIKIKKRRRDERDNLGDVIKNDTSEPKINGDHSKADENDAKATIVQIFENNNHHSGGTLTTLLSGYSSDEND